MEDLDKIYWVRAVTAVVAGLISALTYIFYPLAERGILIGIFFYLLSYYVVRFLLGIKEDKEKNITPKTFILNGLGTYIILWLFTWILLINILL